MKLSLIAAVARNGIIGNKGALPWHLPEDLAFFKQTTLNHPVLMGRTTYESIGFPLPGRFNVILSRQPEWTPGLNKKGEPRPFLRWPSPPPTVDDSSQLAVVPGLPEACEWLSGFEQVFVIGGGTVYHQALESGLADELILTELHHDFEGDARFPEWDPKEFVEISRTAGPVAPDRDWTFDFVRYQNRVKSKQGV